MTPEKSTMNSKEKIEKVQKEVLQIVTAMLERELNKEWFLLNCEKLCKANYDDVVEERNLEHLCGYPVCSELIKKIAKQKYHISKAENKIYDITDRKKFCSNECYKASNYLKAQLHSLPLYMRKQEVPLKLKLLLNSDNKGSVGEELVFENSLSKSEIEVTPTPPVMSANLNSMLQEDIKDCTEHLKNLEIKENIFKNKYVFGDKISDKHSDYTLNENSSDLSDSDSSDSEDKTLFPDHDNIEVLSNKHMPIPECTKKTVLIAPLKASRISIPTQNKLPIDFFAQVFQDWFTEDTMKYLLGEREVFSIKADHLFNAMVNSEESQENLSSIKDEYINLCMKIDKLPEVEDEVSDSPEIDFCEKKPVKKSENNQENIEKLATEISSLSNSTKTNPKRRAKRKTQNKKKSVSFKTDSKTVKKNDEQNITEDLNEKVLLEPVVPLVDSLSQNALRRQVLMSKLKNVYINIFPVIDKHYTDIKVEVKDIVDTFSLTPTNIVYKPKQLNCIAIILFRILTYTKLKEFHNDSEFSKLCEISVTSQNTSQQEIENLVLNLISPNQVLKLQKMTVR